MTYYDYSTNAVQSNITGDIDFSIMLPEIYSYNPFFTQLIDTINYEINRNIKDPIDLGLLTLRSPQAEPYYAALSCQMLGFKMPAFSFTNSQYSLLMSSLGTFYQTRGASIQFINYLNYILNVRINYVPLWANSLDMAIADLTPFPGNETIDNGGTWFATPYFDLTYDPSIYNINQITAETFVTNIAPIHLVLRQLAAAFVIPVSMGVTPFTLTQYHDYSIAVVPT